VAFACQSASAAINPDAIGIDEAEKAFHKTVSQMFHFVIRHGPDGIKSLVFGIFEGSLLASASST